MLRRGRGAGPQAAAGSSMTPGRHGGRLVAVVVLGTLVGCGAGRISTQSVVTVSDPPVFVVSQGQATYPPATTPVGVAAGVGPGRVLQVRSVSTGRLQRDLVGEAGSLSLSSDGSTVYFESIAGRLDPFPIDRVSTGGGRPVRVALGEDPAVSPGGAELAYATGRGDAIAVADLARHTTRHIDLAALIGPGASFNNTPGVVTWLGDSELVAIPPQDSTTTSSVASSPAGRPGSCTAAYNNHEQCAIVIDLSSARPAHLEILPPRSLGISAAGAGPTPGTLLVGSLGSVTRFAVTAMSATRQATVSVPGGGLVEGFSPDGRHVLYLRNHGPVQLWTATITATGIAPDTELLANADLGTVSW